MSNLLGDYLFGVTMLGADPDTSAWDGTYRATIVGGTKTNARLYLSPRLFATVPGGTQVMGQLGVYVRPHFSALIVAGTLVSGTVLDAAIHLSATIVGMTQVAYVPPVPCVLVLQGEVGVSTRRSLLVHGAVRAGAGIRPVRRTTPEEQVIVPVPFYT